MREMDAEAFLRHCGVDGFLMLRGRRRLTHAAKLYRVYRHAYCEKSLEKLFLEARSLRLVQGWTAVAAATTAIGRPRSRSRRAAATGELCDDLPLPSAEPSDVLLSLGDEPRP